MQRKLNRWCREGLLALVVFAAACSGAGVCSGAEDVLIGPQALQEGRGSGQDDRAQAGGQDAGALQDVQGAGPQVNGQSAGEQSAGGQSAGEQSVGIDVDSWELILVNRDNPIPENYQIPAMTELKNGNSVDSRIYPALQRMFDDARAQGIYPYITSSFREWDKQQQLMDDKIAEYKAAGNSDEDARKLAEEWVAIPGTSEHQIGLGLDISSDPSTGQDAGSVWYWMKENAYLYGFIQRYPEDKTDITGIINEPWHYRYVGEEAAAAMHESGQCLEEYLESIRVN